ncbi:TolB family protein [Sulfobacillus harzensis]|uniref:TolB family protein n=1 Tax=Sulfobacillus harzensis TaxID=2729629 RepID=A0A7Y0L4A9_9FIRM|nr:PD40 domain-containing protein [Sulfobacillus harzensis]NMP23052.1 TolB family protein [Sulfobacillus harzensis]
MRKSLLQVVDIDRGECRAVQRFDGVVEAPNWTPDGTRLIFNRAGRLYAWDLERGKETPIDTGSLDRLNNDHVLSPDGREVAFSHRTADDNLSRIYRMPLFGGVPQLVTPNGPSYLHGWSPDGARLVYCAKRHGQFDIYSIDADGREEERQLTRTPELDDGPEYSPDGRHIWFNSAMGGTMQIWRMTADGSHLMPMTADALFHNWFPHVSPDGHWVAFLSYRQDEVEASDHPPGKSVAIRLMEASGGAARTLVELFGGQGTINVNSWSPDSRSLAFVSYEP